MKRYAGMLEHGADLDGELLAALATLFQAEANRTFRALLGRATANARKIVDPATDNAAMRANNSTCPYDAFKEGKRLIFIVEIGIR